MVTYIPLSPEYIDVNTLIQFKNIIKAFLMFGFPTMNV